MFLFYALACLGVKVGTRDGAAAGYRQPAGEIPKCDAELLQMWLNGAEGWNLCRAYQPNQKLVAQLYRGAPSVYTAVDH